MRHILIAAALVLASLLLVQIIAAALQSSATKGHEVTDDFVPGELPRSALPAAVGAGMGRPHEGGANPQPERSRTEPHPADSHPTGAQPLDYRSRTAPSPPHLEPEPQPPDTTPRQPAVQQTTPAESKPGATPPTKSAPPSLKLPAPPVHIAPDPGADRA